MRLEPGDRSAVATPATAHVRHGLLEHLLVLHRELTPDRVVVVGLRGTADHDVEAREVAAGTAAVAKCHAATVPADWGNTRVLDLELLFDN